MKRFNDINLRYFINYKRINSIFLGISVGTIFILYKPLEPSIYSIGGIFLALSMLLIAKFYSKILNRYYFYRLSMMIEFIMLFLIVYFLIFSYSYTTALLIYIGYQTTFAFGSYLIRAETLLLNHPKVLTFLDVAKQVGYLIGMLVSYLFYKGLELSMQIYDFDTQVYFLHFLLLLAEIITITYLFLAFKKNN